jgi:Gpi18-like mannosyltransferase
MTNMSNLASKGSKASNRGILLYIFIFALLLKFSIFLLGISYGTSIPVTGYFGNLEPYRDFTVYYVTLISNFTSGLIPYLQFGCAYPPLFLYLLAPFALVSLPAWAMAIPFVAFDAASVIPVFLIASKFMKRREAIIASIAFAVAPINLFYYDFLWLNSPPMTFFTILAAYAFLSRKYKSAFFFLAVATLFKDVAIALFPVFVVTMLNESDRRNVVGGAALYGATCFVGSLGPSCVNTKASCTNPKMSTASKSPLKPFDRMPTFERSKRL